MNQKNVCMEIKADQFELLEEKKAIQINGGGSDSNLRDGCNKVLEGLSKIMDFFSWK